MPFPIIRLIVAILVTFGFAPGAQANSEIRVAVSIKPLHSLVANMMQGIGEPELIMPGEASPHDYSLKPSNARTLENADLIFWIGPQLETFLIKPLMTLSRNARTIELLDLDEIEHLSLRGFDEDHGDHEDEEHSVHGNLDPHIWLDPLNARTLARHIMLELANLNPENADHYRDNFSRFDQELRALVERTARKLKPLRKGGYLVFHDAYRYFEQRFGFETAGIISTDEHVPPGARHIEEMRDIVSSGGISCVFSEPQFNSSILDVVTEGFSVKHITLDPLGASFLEGPSQYFELIDMAASSFVDCLSDVQ